MNRCSSIVPQLFLNPVKFNLLPLSAEKKALRLIAHCMGALKKFRLISKKVPFGKSVFFTTYRTKAALSVKIALFE